MKKETKAKKAELIRRINAILKDQGWCLEDLGYDDPISKFSIKDLQAVLTDLNDEIMEAEAKAEYEFQMSMEALEEEDFL